MGVQIQQREFLPANTSWTPTAGGWKCPVLFTVYHSPQWNHFSANVFFSCFTSFSHSYQSSGGNIIKWRKLGLNVLVLDRLKCSHFWWWKGARVCHKLERKEISFHWPHSQTPATLAKDKTIPGEPWKANCCAMGPGRSVLLYSRKRLTQSSLRLRMQRVLAWKAPSLSSLLYTTRYTFQIQEYISYSCPASEAKSFSAAKLVDFTAHTCNDKVLKPKAPIALTPKILPSHKSQEEELGVRQRDIISVRCRGPALQQLPCGVQIW